MAKILTGFICFLSLTVIIQSSCTTDQRNGCLDLYHKSTSSWQKGGEIGECQFRQYSEFTHVCKVTNYLPSIDHCCCVDKEEVPDDLEEEKSEDDSIWDRRRKRDAGNILPNGTVSGIGVNASRRTKRNSASSIMCCRYHQHWNQFRCMQPIDTIDQKLMSGSVLHSDNESYVSSILCYGFFIFIIKAVIIVIICVIRRRNKRRAVIRKNNNSVAARTNIAGRDTSRIPSDVFDSFDPVPPPYSAIYAPPYDGPSPHHPLISVRGSRVEPSAPTEADILLRPPFHDYYPDAPTYFEDISPVPTSASTEVTILPTLSSLVDSLEGNEPSSHREISENEMMQGRNLLSSNCGNNDSIFISRESNANLRIIIPSFNNDQPIRQILNTSVVGSTRRLSPPPSYDEIMKCV